MSLPGVTRTQWNLLVFIYQFTTTHGHSPSFAEMAEGIGRTSKGNIYTLVTQLQHRGYLVQGLHARRSPRSVFLTESAVERVVAYLTRIRSTLNNPPPEAAA